MVGCMHAWSCTVMDAGKHLGYVEAGKDGLQLQLRWGAPHAGRGTDVFQLLDDNTLLVTSTAQLEGGGGRAGYRTRYRRRI